MAPKRPSPILDASAASSSEEQFTDAEVEFTEEDESDSGPEPAQKSPTTMPLKKPDTATAESSSDEDEGIESESESGSDSDDGPPVSVVNPNSKLMHDTFMIKKARTKASCMPAPPSIYGPKSVAKRPIEKTGDEKNPKRIKNKEVLIEPEINSLKDGAKKPLFQRVWTEEDELVILEGMIEYISKARANPYNNVDAFHDLIKEGLHIAVTRSQLMDKMRRLKKKFVNNSLKKKNGDARTFSKAFEQKSFDISMKIWGNEANAGLFEPSGKAKKDPAPCAEAVLGDAKVSNESFLLDMSITYDEPNAKLVKEGLSLVDDAKKAELVKKWRKLQCEEAEIFSRRVNLMAEQTKLLLDNYSNRY